MTLNTTGAIAVLLALAVARSGDSGAAGDSVPQPEPGDILVIDYDEDPGHEHTTIFRGGPGSDSTVVDSADAEFSVHFAGWAKTKYRVAGDTMKSFWLEETNTVSLIRLK